MSELKLRAARGERSLVTTLTKATSEELSNHLANLGLKVRYLHSDIETLKRIEVLRDLRLGRFDVLVGINLLREGLDLPEVSLVAILDADKEGYLRSETSLIQTAGRASRNVMGRVLLYADRMTGSMSRAIAEMNRRRIAQVAYNTEHGIVPETIRKEVRSILGEEAEAPSGDLSVQGLGKRWKDKFPLLLANLEEEMHIASERLDFEEAARIRDRIRELKRHAEQEGIPTAPMRAASGRVRAIRDRARLGGPAVGSPMSPRAHAAVSGRSSVRKGGVVRRDPEVPTEGAERSGRRTRGDSSPPALAVEDKG